MRRVPRHHPVSDLLRSGDELRRAHRMLGADIARVREMANDSVQLLPRSLAGHCLASCAAVRRHHVAEDKHAFRCSVSG